MAYLTTPNGSSGRFSANQAIERRASQLGLSYIWGGVAPGRGFDCSGFASWCYFGRRMFTSASADSVLAGYSFHPGSYNYEKGDVVFLKTIQVMQRYIQEMKLKDMVEEVLCLQSQGGGGVCIGGYCGWTHVMRPDEGFGV